MNEIRNIYCVGRNYRLHAAELGNEIPGSPLIFLKPTYALVPMDGGVIELPADHGAIHYEAELVIRIGGAFVPGAGVSELIDAFALGLDLTLRDLQHELKSKQHPWLAAKGFRHAAPITKFHQLTGDPMRELSACSYSLRINGEERQRGQIDEMIFGLDQLIQHIGSFYGLGPGDVIFTGTPAGVGPIEDGDLMELYWGEELIGSARMRIASS